MASSTLLPPGCALQSLATVKDWGFVWVDYLDIKDHQEIPAAAGTEYYQAMVNLWYGIKKTFIVVVGIKRQATS